VDMGHLTSEAYMIFIVTLFGLLKNPVIISLFYINFKKEIITAAYTECMPGFQGY
jgi:hypothetical protein